MRLYTLPTRRRDGIRLLGIVAALVLLVPGLLAAQETTGTDQAEGSTSADLGLDESDFFGEEAVEAEEVQASETYEDSFLTQEGVQIGGSFNMSVQAGLMYKKAASEWTWDYLLYGGSPEEQDAGTTERIEDSFLDLGGTLWFSARPTADLRYYGKLKLGLPFETIVATIDDLEAALDSDATTQVSGTTLPDFKIWELFADFDIDKKAFFRVGKQMVSWGVGYFFQPADIISKTAVDVLDPTAEREGPVAIKANIPLDVHNLDFYLVAPDDIDSITDLSLAGRFTFVVDAWEFGLGALYQKDLDWNFTATASGSIGDFALFGEALVKRTSLGKYLAEGSNTVTIPTGLSAPLPATTDVAVDHYIRENREDWFFDGTAGVMYSNSDAYLTGILQYYFNGEGYDNPTSIADDAYVYLVSGDLSYSNLLGNLGKHYLAASLSWSFVKDSDVSVAAFWMGNLSDGSGMIRPTVTVNLTDDLTWVVYSSLMYGPDNSQFRGLTILGDLATLPLSRFGMTLNFAKGNF